MPAGKIAPNKTRTNITIEKELKSQLEELAKQDAIKKGEELYD